MRPDEANGLPECHAKLIGGSKMGQSVKSIMSKNPIVLNSSDTVAEAARRMADRDVGDVLVMEDGEICGILTDRDIAVRVVARDQDPATTEVGSVCTSDLFTISPDDDLDTAVQMMRERAIRRIPVVDDDEVVGVLSLGDLAQERDASSALGQISAAPPNH
jgi:CBS domain-containing protein